MATLNTSVARREAIQIIKEQFGINEQQFQRLVNSLVD